MSPKSLSAKATKITDVAQRAGVSVTTVSMVLRGKGRISPATAERVQQAIRELDYVPNSAAANLRSQHSNLVGLILRDITDPFYTEVTAGVSEVLEQQGYLLFLTQCGHSPERLQQSIQSLSRQGVAGIIFNPVRGAAAKPLENLLGSALPLVCAVMEIVPASLLQMVPLTVPDELLLEVVVELHRAEASVTSGCSTTKRSRAHAAVPPPVIFGPFTGEETAPRR